MSTPSPLSPASRAPAPARRAPGELRGLARAAAQRETDDDRRLQLARGCTAAVLRAYWRAVQPGPLAEPPITVDPAALPPAMSALVPELSAALARVGPDRAFYELGRLYTALLPATYRARYGVYYTPPELAERLLDQATAAGLDWATCRVLDPACGGGAFLAPVARRMLKAVRRQQPGVSPAAARRAVCGRLHGYEIDSFAAWISRVAVDAVLWVPDALVASTGVETRVGDATATADPRADVAFDLVVGNPPYGRVGLPPPLRARYRRSLYGHANLYGVFTDLALRHARPGGIVAYVTPTSFLAGSYYQNLRRLLASEAPPVSLDFVEARRGVFDDVLQETLLAVYRKDATPRQVPTATLVGTGDGRLRAHAAGAFELPAAPDEPWLAPRTPAQAELLAAGRSQPARLADWGYRVSTGPLVWNRHKPQLTATQAADCLPLVWAESVSADGRFRFRAEKKNHLPYCRIRDRRDHWLVVRAPCVLVQRTTAKEQARRLIAAELPAAFLAAHGGAVVENHLNMIRPLDACPRVPAAVLAALLNARVVDELFRCISGSVAVSAYELSALPLPAPDRLDELTALVAAGAGRAELDAACERLYGCTL
ncbi:MAG: N-6 DNA methylase [Gammaproteobacteria bacterium]|jgi:adenine-specific DNA-methyltransferase|nr:N-6 DNA methylase [Gammaproteobacteria bacterium]